MTESRAGGAPRLSRAAKLIRTASTIRIVAVACAVAEVGLDGGAGTLASATAAAMRSMGMSANALAGQW